MSLTFLSIGYFDEWFAFISLKTFLCTLLPQYKDSCETAEGKLRVLSEKEVSSASLTKFILRRQCD